MNRWYRYQALEGRFSGAPSGRPPELRRRAFDAVLSEREAQRQVRAEDRRRRILGLLLTTGVALLAHAGLLLPLFTFWLLPPHEAVQRTRVQWVSMGKSPWHTQRRWRAEEGAAREPRRREREETPRDEPDPPGQIVALPRSTDERPDHADYVADSNHKTDRETRSRHPSQDYLNPTHKPQVGLDEQRHQPLEGGDKAALQGQHAGEPGGPEGPGVARDGTSGLDRKSGEGAPRFALELPRQRERDALDLPESESGTRRNRPRQEAIETENDRLTLSMGRSESEGALRGDGTDAEPGVGMRGGSGDEERLPSLAELTPSLVEVERLSGMPANDYLPEVETDAETRLNAWRWKHSTFFYRVKQRLNREWRGGEVYRRHDPTRQIYGTQPLITVLRVTIDRQGNVVEVNVASPSGADFWDDEALRAMTAAAPFSNPPEGLFGGRDTFTFDFGFAIEHNRWHIDLDWRPY